MAPDFHVIMRDSPRIFWGYFSIPAGFFLKSSRDKFGCLKISFKVFSWRFFFLLFASFEIYIHALMFLFAVRFTKLLRLFFTPLLSFLLSIYKFFFIESFFHIQSKLVLVFGVSFKLDWILSFWRGSSELLEFKEERVGRGEGDNSFGFLAIFLSLEKLLLEIYSRYRAI